MLFLYVTNVHVKKDLLEMDARVQVQRISLLSDKATNNSHSMGLKLKFLNFYVVSDLSF